MQQVQTCIWCGGKLQESRMRYLVTDPNTNVPLLVDNIPCVKCMDCGDEFVRPEIQDKVFRALRDVIEHPDSPAIPTVTLKHVNVAVQPSH